MSFFMEFHEYSNAPLPPGWFPRLRIPL
uniref:Uncharacterized protein n=1 Tax=Anguilla anguilla TaxID=7936 RepID=A0A0E9UAJ4_ANGAN